MDPARLDPAALDALLSRASLVHAKHGASHGMNFVECATCEFHVHETPYGLKLHWRNFSDEDFIVDESDERLQATRRSVRYG